MLLGGRVAGKRLGSGELVAVHSSLVSLIRQLFFLWSRVGQGSEVFSQLERNVGLVDLDSLVCSAGPGLRQASGFGSVLALCLVVHLSREPLEWDVRRLPRHLSVQVVSEHLLLNDQHRDVGDSSQVHELGHDRSLLVEEVV